MPSNEDDTRAAPALRHEFIFQMLPDPAGISRLSDGLLIEANTAFCEMLGLPCEAVLGRTSTELEYWADPHQRQRLFERLQRDGYITRVPIMAQRRDGPALTPIPGVVSARTVHLHGEDCVVFIFHNVAAERRAAAQLHQSEERFTRIFQLVDQPMGLSRVHDGQYLEVNPAWEAMIGIARENALGRTAVEMGILTSEARKRLMAACHRNGGALTNYELELRASDGRRITALQSMRMVNFEDESCWLFTAHDISERKRDEERMQRMAHTDALTGLPNRMELAQRLQAAMHDARATGTQLGVAYLDLDGFKPVNDRLGHEAGDRLLVTVGTRLTSALGPGDCVARLGGDEFVILLPGVAGREGCEHLLRQTMDSISAPYHLGGERATLTTSIGYTLYPEDDADADTLLRHADQAMYQAKESGRNRFHGFDAQLDRSERERREQGQRIRAGLDNGEFTLYLQPKVDLRTGAVVGAEALARWNHPERGVLGPGAFLPALKGTELETDFDQWVFEEALRSIEALQRQGLHLPLSINVAAQHIQQPGFARWVIDCLVRHPGVATEQVELEITESAALYDVAHVAHELAQLRGLGISVALDDFGTGYSSLTYLRRLPMDKIKIDQSFVHGMMRDAGDRAIVQSVIGLAHSFNYHVIAEGVETLEQGWMLQQMGCPLAQGYCIARPMPLADFAPWAAQWRLPAAWLPTDWQAHHSSDHGGGGYAGA